MPAVLLNKTDLAEAVDARKAEIEEIALGAQVLVSSCLDELDGLGLDEVRSLLRPRETAVLVGSSGVGKSTLINRLLDENVQATREVRRSDDRGRHTTTRRELFRMPGGALLIDNPGIRELQLWAEESALDHSFEDIARLATHAVTRIARTRPSPAARCSRRRTRVSSRRSGSKAFAGFRTSSAIFASVRTHPRNTPRSRNGARSIARCAGPDVVESSMSEPRLRTSLFAGFALLAFVLSAVGIYGVMSYTVKERTHDIGIRMALGASRRRILRETLLEGMRPVLAGMGLGLLLSLFATRALTGFLFEVEGTDPAVYAVVACLLGGVAMAAGFVPAQRASQSDPLEVLNAEN